MSIKINFLKFLIGIILLVGMGAGFFGQAQDSSILSERTTVPTGAKRHAIELKGQVYYVTDDQAFLCDASRDVFFGSWTALAFMIWLRKHKEMKASQEKLKLNRQSYEE